MKKITPLTRILAVLCALGIVTAATIVSAATTSGSLTSNEIWSGTVTITGDVTVPSNVTLTIQPGTTVIFTAGSDDTGSGTHSTLSELIINGSLIAEGTDVAPIVFTSSSGTAGDWGGIRASLGVTLSTFSLIYATIEYATIGVEFKVASGIQTISLANSTIHTTSDEALYIYGDNSAKITLDIHDNLIEYCSDRGIHAQVTGSSTQMSGSISNNEIHNNNGYGCYVYSTGGASSDTIIHGNTIYDNSYYGIYVILGSSGSSTATISENTLSNHSSYNIYCTLSSTYDTESFAYIKDNIVSTGGGIYCYASRSTATTEITGNVVTQTNSNGIYYTSQDYSYTTNTTISGNTCYGNSQNGIYVYAGSSTTVYSLIDGNTVYNNSYSGIQVNRYSSSTYAICYPTITRNIAYGNTNPEIKVNSLGEAIILHNTIKDNDSSNTGCIYLKTSDGTLVNNNNIESNASSYGIELGNSQVVNAQYNYWGTNTTAEMNAGPNPTNISAIYDDLDDTSLGTVDYQNWLSSEITHPTGMQTTILSPKDGSARKASHVTITGSAVSSTGIKRIEVSSDNGSTWNTAIGLHDWSYEWTVAGDGTYTILARIIDNDDTAETPGDSVTVTIDSGLFTTSGTLSSNETWSGTVTVTGDITIPSGVTLTIDPGTTVRFSALNDDTRSGEDQSLCELIIYGSLNASGTYVAPITFTSTSAYPSQTDWYGIRIMATAENSSVTMAYLSMPYTQNGLYCYADSFSPTVTVSNSDLSNTAGYGVYCVSRDGSTLSLSVTDSQLSNHDNNAFYCITENSTGTIIATISGNTILNTGDEGIYLRNSSGIFTAVIEDNIISSTSDYGIYFSSSTSYDRSSKISCSGNTISNTVKGINITFYRSTGSFLCEDNEVYNCSQDGIYLSGSDYGYTVDAQFRRNTVHDNSQNGIYCYAASSSELILEFTANTIYNNTQQGIYCNRYNSTSAKISPVFTMNKVYQNGQYELYCKGTDPAVILYNDIKDNDTSNGGALFVGCGVGSIANYNNIDTTATSTAIYNNNANSINARYNSWGAYVLAEINAGSNPKNLSAIYDSYDDAATGTVDYSQWSETAITLPDTLYSQIMSPADGTVMKASVLRLQGYAAAQNGVQRVEISTDGGTIWNPADGTENWFYDWTIPVGGDSKPIDGTYTIQARVVDLNNVTESPGSSISVEINSNLPTTSGILSEDEIWNDASIGGPITLTGDITIPAGITLTIEAGTTILFEALSDDQGSGNNTALGEFIVIGTLNITGTDGTPVTITSSSASPSKGDWYGISVESASTAVVNMSYCNMSYCSTGFYAHATATSPSITADHVTVEHISDDGANIRLENGAVTTYSFTDCQFLDCNDFGMDIYITTYTSSLTLSLTNTDIADTGNYGIKISNGSAPNNISISGGSITNTVDYGIYMSLSSSYNYGQTITIENNAISNTGKGIYCSLSKSDATVNIIGNTVENSTSGDGIYLKVSDYGYTLTGNVSNNIVHDSTGYGMYLGAGSSSTMYIDVHNNTVYNNTNHGIYFYRYNSTSTYTYPVVTLNKVYGNGQWGIYCPASGGATLLYNEVYNNTGGGVFLKAGIGNVANFNNFYNNGNYDFNNNNSNPVNARFNWWGADTTLEIEGGNNPQNLTKIYDSFDDASYGTVDYSSWNSTQITVPATLYSDILTPADGASVKASVLRIQGIAVAPKDIQKVIVSTDGGTTWVDATGTTQWYYDWAVPGDGNYTIQARVVDINNTEETPGSAINITIDSSLPTTSGSLTENETWSGIVTLTGDVTIPAGITLTIDPGTIIRSVTLNDDRADGENASLIELIVIGSLYAQGTSENPITFTSTSITGSTGEWYGLRILSDDPAQSVDMNYCTVEYAFYGLRMPFNANTPVVSFRNGIIQNITDDGVFLETLTGADVTFELTGTTISNTGDEGMHLYLSSTNSTLSATIEDCSIDTINDYGIYLENGNGITDLLISGTTIHDTGNHGIYVSPSTSYDRAVDVSIENCTIFNAATGVYVTYNRTDGTLNLSGSTIYSCSQGVYLSVKDYGYTLTASILNNIVHDNTNDGIYCYAGSASTLNLTCSGNTVYNNSGDGIYIQRYNSTSTNLYPVITLNEVYNNNDWAVYCKAYPEGVTALYNFIHDNNSNALFINAQEGSIVAYNNFINNSGSYALQNAGSTNINARYNYWDTATTSEMATGSNPKNIATIYDSFDDAAIGTVSYEPWLTAEETQPASLYSKITSPENNSEFKTSVLRIQGFAVSPYGVTRVEVSPDNGINWYECTGVESWYYDWTVPADLDGNPLDATYTILSRVIDKAFNIETPGTGTTITINSTLPTTSGPMSSDEVWSGSITLTGDVTVPSGVTLEIDAGATIGFSALSDDQGGGDEVALSELVVEGSLIIAGTPSQHVILTSSLANPSSGDWSGIRFIPEQDNDSLTVTYCDIEYAKTGIYAYDNGYDAALDVSNTTITHSSVHGMHLETHSSGILSVSICDSIIDDSAEYGIYCDSTGSYSRTNGLIQNITVSNTGDDGIYLHASNAYLSFEFDGTNINNTGAHGIYFYPHSSYNGSDLTFNNGIISSVAENGLYVTFYRGGGSFIACNNTISLAENGIYLKSDEYGYTVKGLIAGNTAYSNSADGIHCYTDSSSYQYLEVLGNTLYQNIGNGINLRRYNSTSAYLYPVVAFNTSNNNAGSGIRANSLSAAIMPYNNLFANISYDVYNLSSYAVDSRFCNWSASTITEMEANSGAFKNISSIYDIFDDSSKGTVNYMEWNSTPIDISSGLISRITTPLANEAHAPGIVTFKGVAYAQNGIKKVEISLDNGTTWQETEYTSGFDYKSSWEYTAEILDDGAVTVLTRVTDTTDAMESPVNQISFSIDSSVITTIGTISTDQTWSGIVRLTGDVYVPEGITLIILPDTTILFPALRDDTNSGNNSSLTELIIDGSLIAEGSETQPILFTSDAATPQKGDWLAIEGSGSLYIDYATMEYGTYGVDLFMETASSYIDISNTTIEHMLSDGISLYASNGISTTASIADCSITDCDDYGIDCDAAEYSTQFVVTITNTSVSDNGTRGISIYSHNSYPEIIATVSNTEISGHGEYGLYAQAVSGAVMHLTAENNIIHHSGQGIYFYTSADWSPDASCILTGNEIYSGSGGIKIYSGRYNIDPVTIENNVIYNNSSNGIHCDYGSYSTGSLVPSITGNQVYNNAGYGVSLKCTAAITEFTNNSLYGNASYDVYNNTANTVNAQGNWWGTDTSSNEMELGATNISKIYDYYDNSAKGIVDFSNWMLLFTVPGAPVLNAVTTPTATTDQVLTGTKDADTSIVLNGIEVIPVSSDTTWFYSMPLLEGTNSISLVSKTTSGMTSAATTSEIILDTTAPYIFSSVPANNAFVKRTVSVVDITLYEPLTEIDNDAILQTASIIDGASDPVTGSWSSSYNHILFTPDSSLGEGSYTINMSLIDKPLANSDSATLTFTVDMTTPPAPGIDTIISPTQSTTYTVTGTKEAFSEIWMGTSRLVSSTADETWSYDFTLSEGYNEYTIISKDRAGNASETVTFFIVRDTQAPVLVSASPANSSFIMQSPAQITLDYNDVTSSLNIQDTLASAQITNSGGQVIGSSALWSMPDGHTVTFTPDGELVQDTYTVTVDAYDMAGNIRHTTISFTYDIIPPAPPTLNPVTSPTTYAVQTLSGTKDAYSSVWLNDGQIVTVNSSLSWSYQLVLQEGANDLILYSKDAAGNQSTSISSSIQYDETAPLPVSTLTADGNQTGQVVKLNWSGYNESLQGDISHYRIYYEETLFTQLTGLTPKTTVPKGNFNYTVDGLQKGTRYFFAVVAEDTKGNALNSVTPVTATPLDTVAPENPSNLTIECFDDRLIFSWTHSLDSYGDLAGYTIYFSGDVQGINFLPTTSVFDKPGLSPATGYDFKITAYDSDGNESSGLSTTAATLLQNPTTITPDPQNGKMHLTWDPSLPSNLVKNYKVYVSLNNFSSIEGKTASVTSTSTSATIAGLENNVTYYFGVAAVNVSNGVTNAVTTISASPVPDSDGPELSNIQWNAVALTDGMTITKPGSFTLTATDPSLISRVEFSINSGSVLSYSDSNGSTNYACYWNISAVPDDSYSLLIKAYDSLGNMTSASYTVIVSLDAPEPPIILDPSDGFITNQATIYISGTAEQYSQITIADDTDTTLVSSVQVSNTGSFTAPISLSEGDNIIKAQASNRAGDSAFSAPITITLDTTIPAAPGNVTATPKPDGNILIQWQEPLEPDILGYNIYRSTTSFTSLAQATKINTAVEEEVSYADIPDPEGLYYYAVTSVDLGLNESPLSQVVSARSDATDPEADIVYTPEGNYDPTTGRMSTGNVGLTVTVSEILKQAPFINVTISGITSPLSMTKTSDFTYTGHFTLTDSSGTGTGIVQFSGFDKAGNNGHTVNSGSSFKFDTEGPSVVKVILQQETPLKNDVANPLDITAFIGLDEAVNTSINPSVSYLLSGTGRTETSITNITRVTAQAGEVERWKLEFTLPADAGETEVETFHFIFQATDDLDNVSTEIDAPNLFQVYQGDLPPLDIPSGLDAESMPDGEIYLAWNEVEDADDYELYRKAQGDPDFTLLDRSLGLTEYIDTPPAEGTYFYTISSVRQANGQEAISGQSNPVSAVSDATAPGAPQNLTLELTGQGIYAVWEAPPLTETITYTIYRSNQTEILTVDGLTPLAQDIDQLEVIDPHPSATEHCYAVTAVDQAGNESAPSNYYYLNFQLLPISSVTIEQTDTDFPVLNWTHSHFGSSISHFDVFLINSGTPYKLNAVSLYGLSYTDTGYSDDERKYSIVSFDTSNNESVGREVTLPSLDVELISDAVVKRNIMNRLEYSVQNTSSVAVTNAKIKIELGDETHTSASFSLAPNETATVPVIVGGYPDLRDPSPITRTIEITPNVGETVRIIRSGSVSVENGLMQLSFQNEPLLRGGQGTVQFTFTNTSTEEIEIVTAEKQGNSNSSEITLYLTDTAGNVISSQAFKQTVGSQITTLSNGKTVARIAGGESFTSDPFEIFVPLNAPDNTILELHISKVHYKLGKAEHVEITGINTSRAIKLVDTAYYGEISSIQQFPDNDSVLISGQAINRSTGAAMAGVPLQLIVTVRGYERSYNVYTDYNGQFSTWFEPLTNESGSYTVCALHPDMTDRPVHASFTINKLFVSFGTLNISVPRNYDNSFYIQVQTGKGTSVTNVRIEYEEDQQPTGTFPQGVHIEPEAGVDIGSNRTQRLSFNLWADNTADDIVRLVLSVKSDEITTGAWGYVTVNIEFSDSYPILYHSPNYVETGVERGNSVTEKIILANKGLATLNDVNLKLFSDDKTSASPSWIYFVTNHTPGDDIEVGDSPNVFVTFNPPSDQTVNYYTFYLRVSSSNYPDTFIPLYAAVSESGYGNVQFKVTDIYTGTLDEYDQPIPGVEGAYVRIQHDTLTGIEFSKYTDSQGVAYFGDPNEQLPAGSYKCRITSQDHEEYIGRVWIKPGITVNHHVPIVFNLISVEWEVVPTTIEDKYDIILKATYKTHVPAPVIAVEPASIALPEMKQGDVFNSEFDLVNYGLIRSDEILYSLPATSSCYKYEMLEDLPTSIEAQERITIPYRVTKLCDDGNTTIIIPGDGDGDGDWDNDGDIDNDGEVDNDAVAEYGCTDCIRTYEKFLMTCFYECTNGDRYSQQGVHVTTWDNGKCDGCAGLGFGTYQYWPDVSQQGSGGGPVPEGGGERMELSSGNWKKWTAPKCWLVGSRFDGYLDFGSATGPNGCRNCIPSSGSGSRSGNGSDGPNGPYDPNNPGYPPYSNPLEYYANMPRPYYFQGGLWREMKESTGLKRVVAQIGTGGMLLVDDICEVGSNIQTRLSGGTPSEPYYKNYSDPYYDMYTHNSTDTCDLRNQFTCRSAVNPLTREYNDEKVDLMIQTPAGQIKVKRLYYDEAWRWMHIGNNLEFEKDLLNRYVKTIFKKGTVYKRVSDGVWMHGTFTITKQSGGYRWSDKNGNWNTFDDHGRMLAHGDRFSTICTLMYETGENGKLIGLKDVDDRQVVWYEYNPDNTISAVRDHLNRRVEYGYTSGNLTLVTDLRNNDTEYRYTNGLLTGKTDAAGHETTIIYDVYGSVESVVDVNNQGHSFEYFVDRTKREPYIRTVYPSGKVEETWYSRFGDMSRLDVNGRTMLTVTQEDRNYITTDEKGNVTYKYYDEWHNLVKVVNPDATQITYEYEHTYNQVTKMTDERGVVTDFEYDNNGQLLSMTEAAGTSSERVSTFTYNSYGQLETVTLEADTNTDLAQYIFTYDSNGNISTITDPLNNVVEFPDYDVHGYYKEMEDTRGKMWYRSYDDSGNITSSTNALGEISSYTYDGNNNLKTVTTPENDSITMVYDDNNNIISLTDTEGNAISMGYHGAKTLNSYTDQLGHTTSLEFDEDSRIKKEVDGAGNEISYIYNETDTSFGTSFEVSELVYPTMTRKKYYNRRQKVTRISDQLDLTTSYSTGFGYDASGNITEVTDKEDKVTSYTYDELNRITAMTDADNETIHYVYDDRDNVIEETDRNTHSIDYTYNAINNLTSMTRPTGEEFSYNYDEAGNLISLIDGENHKAIYDYDNAGQLNIVYYYNDAADTSPAKTVSFSYNATGSLTSFSDGTVSATLTYDNMQRLLSETIDYGSFSSGYTYTYYANGLKKTCTGPDGVTVTYLYDSGNRLSAIDIPGTGQINFNTYLWRQPSKITYPGGTTREIAYTAMMRIQSITDKDPGQNIIQAQNYTYTPSGMIDSHTDENGVYQFTYDNLYRIIGVDYPSTNDEAYTYDAEGNRLTSMETTGTWSYTDSNELTGVDSLSFTHDDTGRRTSFSDGSSTINYFYDAAGNLIRIENDTGTVIVEYYYDPFGRRLWKEAGGTRTYYLYSDAGLLAELDQSGNLIRQYGYAPHLDRTELVYMKVAAGQTYYWLHPDALGSIRKLSSMNGAQVWSASYTTFGTPSIDTAIVSNNLMYHGHYYDSESGLYFTGDNYYDPSTGLFLIPTGDGAVDYTYPVSTPANQLDRTDNFTDSSSVSSDLTAITNMGAPPGPDRSNLLDFKGDFLKIPLQARGQNSIYTTGNNTEIIINLIERENGNE